MRFEKSNMSKRIEKINKLLQKEVAQILSSQIDFGKSFVTITNVKTMRDLQECKILITVFPQEDEKRVLKLLKGNIWQLQKTINKRLKMRPVPKIHFEIDEGMKNLYKIDKISQEKNEKFEREI